jgi:hypothetical protein
MVGFGGGHGHGLTKEVQHQIGPSSHKAESIAGRCRGTSSQSIERSRVLFSRSSLNGGADAITFVRTPAQVLNIVMAGGGWRRILSQRPEWKCEVSTDATTHLAGSNPGFGGQPKTGAPVVDTTFKVEGMVTLPE